MRCFFGFHLLEDAYYTLASFGGKHFYTPKEKPFCLVYKCINCDHTERSEILGYVPFSTRYEDLAKLNLKFTKLGKALA